MKRFIFCIFSFLLFFNTIIIAQEVVWQKKMLQSSWTTGYSIKQTTDGNFIVCGITNRFDGFITKLNSLGDTLWVKIYPVWMVSIVESNDGNYVAIGQFTITKISPNGDILWFKPISEPTGDLYCEFITKTNDGNFIVAGRLEQNIGFAYIAKFDNEGNKIWSKKHSTRYYYQQFNHIKQLDDGNFIATGSVNIGNNIQVLLMKFNSTGDVIWQINYGTSYKDFANSVFQLPDKAFLTIGTVWYSSFYMKLYFTKTDSDGNFIWSKFYGDTNTGFTIRSSDCAVEDKLNNTYVITGVKDTLSFLLAIDQNAEKVWEKIFGLDSFEVSGAAVDICKDSGFVVCGDVFRSPFYDSDPQFLYALRTTKPKIIGINNNSNHIPLFLKLYQNFPNPFNGQTFIEFDLPIKTEIKIKIFDLLGREIETIVKGIYDAGVYRIANNAENLASGVYIYSLETENFRMSKKFVLIK